MPAANLVSFGSTCGTAHCYTPTTANLYPDPADIVGDRNDECAPVRTKVAADRDRSYRLYEDATL